MRLVKCNVPNTNDRCSDGSPPAWKCAHLTPHEVYSWCAPGRGCANAQCVEVNAQQSGVVHDDELSDKSNLIAIRRKRTMSDAWETGFTIKTPKGDYKPKSDDLAAEIKAAARFAGIKSPHVTVGFNTIDNPSNLPVACISGLEEDAIVEVSAYDFAG